MKPTKTQRKASFKRKNKKIDRFLHNEKIKKIWRFIQRENLDRIVFFIIVLVLCSAIGLCWLEPKEKQLTLADGVWWSIVTLATVGYGDISPSTFGSRLIAIVNMIVGVSLLATFSATIASLLIGQRLREDLGMNSYNCEDHIILCEWNARSKVIINELRYDPQTQESPIVLLANIERKPIDDDKLFFVQGQVTDETLHRANLLKAKTVIILGDDRLDETARDAKVVLSTLTVESINPNVYTIVELVDDAYIPACKRARADEVIVGSELSSMLISQATLNHGITKVISEILTSQYGNQLYKIPLPQSKIGLSFIEAFTHMKQDYQSIILAVQKGSEGKVIANPPNDYLFESDDYLIVVAREKPAISKAV